MIQLDAIRKLVFIKFVGSQKAMGTVTHSDGTLVYVHIMRHYGGILASTHKSGKFEP